MSPSFPAPALMALALWLGASALAGRPLRTPRASAYMMEGASIFRQPAFLLGKPDLLLADEPTGNVDPVMARRLMYLFVELNKIGTTLLIASHDTSLIRQFDQPCMELKDGTLVMHRDGLP